MIAKQQIRQTLFNSGLSVGDHLVVHSSLRSVGRMRGGADALLDALIEVVGETGTIIMPSFTYTTNIPKPYFNFKDTPGRTGALTEVFRKRQETLRSLHPTHSVIGQEARAREFLGNHIETTALGIDSPLDRVARA